MPHFKVNCTKFDSWCLAFGRKERQDTQFYKLLKMPCCSVGNFDFDGGSHHCAIHEATTIYHFSYSSYRRHAGGILVYTLQQCNVVNFRMLENSCIDVCSVRIIIISCF